MTKLTLYSNFNECMLIIKEKALKNKTLFTIVNNINIIIFRVWGLFDCVGCYPIHYINQIIIFIFIGLDGVLSSVW